MREYNAISYYEKRERRLRGLAAEVEDVVISSGYLEMADRYSAIISTLVNPTQGHGSIARGRI